MQNSDHCDSRSRLITAQVARPRGTVDFWRYGAKQQELNVPCRGSTQKVNPDSDRVLRADGDQ